MIALNHTRKKAKRSKIISTTYPVIVLSIEEWRNSPRDTFEKLPTGSSVFSNGNTTMLPWTVVDLARIITVSGMTSELKDEGNEEIAWNYTSLSILTQVSSSGSKTPGGINMIHPCFKNSWNTSQILEQSSEIKHIHHGTTANSWQTKTVYHFFASKIMLLIMPMVNRHGLFPFDRIRKTRRNGYQLIISDLSWKACFLPLNDDGEAFWEVKNDGCNERNFRWKCYHTISNKDY